MLSASCSIKYIEPIREGNSVIRFINQSSVVTIFEDATECTGEYGGLPWPELVVKSNKELAFSILTSVGETDSHQYLTCTQMASFVPKPDTYYTINQYVPRNTRSCLLEIMQRVPKNDSYHYVPYKPVYIRKRKVTLFESKAPGCYPLKK